ncbi:MAG: threonine synthase [Sphingomonadales bacterium]|nr:threonine synthase [Sphingomonadales bacterium]
MLFESTRGLAPKLNFKDAVLSGLAPDGGLYMPVNWPQFNGTDMAELSYTELAHKIIKEFVGDSVSEDKLRTAIDVAYAKFPQPDIVPLTNMGDNLYLMELYHGPTHSFKDVAMQFIGALFDQMLDEGSSQVTILGATSGDTGSAAIAAFAGKKSCRIVMLHPNGRISAVQRKQMTTVMDSNVLNIAVDGDFDQCQAMVKTLMSDADFKAKHALTTVNSINWARIAAQSVYYAYMSLRLAKEHGEQPRFVVPSGNFGNAFSAFVARSMGFPVGQVFVATNDNDGLNSLVSNGTYIPKNTKATISPAMDIQWASNYERLLFALGDENKTGNDDLKNYIDAYAAKETCQMSAELQQKISSYFSAATVSQAQTKQMMLAEKARGQVEIDPHTAVGLYVAMLEKDNATSPIVSLATAHPAKFPETYEEVTGQKPQTPDSINALWQRREKFETCHADIEALKKLINKGS